MTVHVVEHSYQQPVTPQELRCMVECGSTFCDDCVCIPLFPTFLVSIRDAPCCCEGQSEVVEDSKVGNVALDKGTLECFG